MADAHTLVTGYLRGARDHGAEVRCDEVVGSLLVERGRCVGVSTAQGPVHAGAVVLAAGAWSAHLAARVGLDRPLIPLRRTLLHTQPHPLSAADHPWCWIGRCRRLRAARGRRLAAQRVRRGRRPAGPGAGLGGSVEPEPRALAVDKVERFVPALSGIVVRGGWTGLRTFAPDRRPVLGADPDLPGLWWAAGLGGFGVTCSVAVGEAVAGWLLDEPVSWLPARAVSPGRRFPRRWPIRPRGTLEGARLVEVSGRR